MKKCIVWIACMMLSVAVFAQVGVKFEALSFEKALKKAKSEKKLVFIDCYTEWCVPCKMMAKDVLSSKEIGDLLNPTCVSIKCDMEKEGKVLLDKYPITAYPTFLIVRPDGMLQHKIVGGSDIKRFATELKPGLCEETSMYYLKNLYETGKGSKKDVAAYMSLLLQQFDRETAVQVATKLFSMLTDEERLSPDYWFLFTSLPVIGDERCIFVLNNIESLRKSIGESKVNVFLRTLYYRKLKEEYYFDFSNNKLKDSEEVRRVLEEMQRELLQYEIPGKSTFLFYANWFEKCLNKNTIAITDFLKEYFVDSSNLWFVKTLYTVVETDGNQENLKSLAFLKDAIDQLEQEQKNRSKEA